MQIEDNLTKISSVLSKNGIILYPVDGVWGIACNACSEIAINKITNTPISLNPYNEILVADILMLKSYTDQLHPRVETLLTYHQRPIRLLIDEPLKFPSVLLANGNKLCFRIVKDKWSRRLISTFGGPLFVHSFVKENGNIPLPIEEVRSLVLPDLDFVPDYDTYKPKQEVPIILASFDEEGLLTIH